MTDITVHLSVQSENRKVGPIPVSTSPRSTCPPTCPLAGDNGCYAENFPMKYHWDAVDNGRGYEWDDFLLQIRALKKNQIWRHNQAGDLVGELGWIDVKYLQDLVEANRGRRGFTYTHYPMDHGINMEVVKFANCNGFTINLSADSPLEADKLAALGVAPVVCMIPRGTPNTSETPGGLKITRCPAEHVEYMTCAVCQLCQKAERTTIVGFTVHGSRFKKAAKIIEIKSVR